MCRLRSLLAAAVLVAAALDFTASPAITALVTGTASNARTAPVGTFATQSVDRRHKGDRLSPQRNTERVIERSRPASSYQPAPILDGCSPAFSPLSSPAALNYPARCVAENTAWYRLA